MKRIKKTSYLTISIITLLDKLFVMNKHIIWWIQWRGKSRSTDEKAKKNTDDEIKNKNNYNM